MGINRFFSGVEFAIAALLMSQSCSAAFAQEGKATSPGEDVVASQAGPAGPGARGNGIAAARSGGADGLGNPLLGGERRPLYRLRPSDVVEVSFTMSPEFNQTLTVQPDGFVALRDAGMVYAQGLAVPDFSEAVKHAYHGYLHDPQVAVALKQFDPPSFVVGGEVGRPGKYELRADTTVAEAVQIAGGLTSQAKHSQVVLFRRVNDDLVEARLINLKKMLKENNLGEDAHLRPGDLIFVPQNVISKISRYLTRPTVSMYMNSSQF
jgi:polysaccharide export outer membrane protein